MREALEAAGVEIESAELTMEPKSTVEVKGNEAEALLRLLETLDEHDDVDEVHANFDIPEEVLRAAALRRRPREASEAAVQNHSPCKW